jgi:hypothetical protein
MTIVPPSRGKSLLMILVEGRVLMLSVAISTHHTLGGLKVTPRMLARLVRRHVGIILRLDVERLPTRTSQACVRQTPGMTHIGKIGEDHPHSHAQGKSSPSLLLGYCLHSPEIDLDS